MDESALRWRDLPRVAAALAAEAVLLGVLWAAAPLLGSVPLSHLGVWVHATAPADAVTAIARLGGMVLAGWLLASTVLYVAASLAGAQGLIRRTGWVTLPMVRRMVDGMTAASILASTVTASAAGAASASPAPAGAVVHPLTAPRPAGPGQATAVTAQAQPRVPAVVSDRVVGRHLPHPGLIEHAQAAAYFTSVLQAPSPAGAFAGLAPGTRVVVVQPGDCLSVIAQEHLGDWRLDTEIHQLNVGRVQPDGRALSDDHWIYPGWVLVMPADAVGTQVVPGPTATAPPAHPASTPAAPASAGPSPTGAPPASTPPSNGPSPAPHAATGHRAIPPVAATPPAGTNHPPGVSAGRGGEPAPPSGGQGSGGPHPSETSHREAKPGDSQTPVPAGPIVGMAGLVAAGVMWRLRRRRTDQMHGRRWGRALPVNPPPVVAAETAVRVIADEEAMRWVDAGLRYLGGQLADRQAVTPDNDNDNDDDGDGAVGGEESTVPSVVLVRAGGRGLEVMIAPACPEAPEGWEAIDEGAVWALRPEIDLDDLEARAAGRWAFLPAVVTVGTTVDGTVLTNLEHAGSLAVEGDPERVRAVLGQMLVELTSQPWADEMLAGLHALGDLGAQQLAGVDVDDDPMVLAETLDRAADRTTAAVAGVTSAAAPSAAARRAVDGEWLPEVAVAFAGTDPKALRCLIEAALPDRSGVAVVAAGAAVDARWRLTVDESGAASLAGLAGDHPFRLPLDVQADPEVIGLVGQALRAAADPADRDPTAASQVPAAADRDPTAASQVPAAAERVRAADAAEETGRPVERGEVEIRFLGTVRVVGDAGRVDAARRDASLAVLAYLATRGAPVSMNDLAGALWPPDASKERFGMPAPKTVHNVVSRARALLGADADGEHRLGLAGGGYVLAGSVTSDWGRFQALAALGREAGSTQEAAARYRQALELVEGAPFAGSLDSQFFEWVSGEQLEYTIAATVVDAAEELARLALEAGDHDGVAWAVERGLGMDPAREQLYQYWMHALGRTAEADRVTAVWKRLCAALQAHIDPAQAPSPDSQAVYRSYVVRHSTRP
ncbi:LysM peptidoglycan-binding domain-containing protein [Acidiferrimicrobium sp. IK]|uniref:BTAD domain-containing putative transcriptional regulator n=1 Tax=Acidiferrimicrobium sp. IK TaxID=2871700 RepID=UPI0021CB55E1|nr:BTAD domain-containing putative transcriptional regulator [Acidiferrimicrobium sp. IK]MCU4186446.1 LysM peptidoglycan-binding domain-containing protein [Acidiferrimicrobium sp. IK]